jgi:SAM-dependent methyltransferase
MTAFSLEQAEALEQRAAEERVEYYSRLIRPDRLFDATDVLVDVGCGNGFAVEEWRRRGVKAVGIDASPYRFSRWMALYPDRKPFVIADAAALPFRTGAARGVIASGVLEHIGVEEGRDRRYWVRARRTRDAEREAVVRELLRVLHPGSPLFVDFPNGSFPIDFWHGDEIASFRVHRLPDALCPTFSDVLVWGRRAGATVSLHRLRGRLNFRQIGTRAIGRILSPVAKLFLLVLDGSLPIAPRRLVAFLYPFLVMELREPLPGSGSVTAPPASR